MKGLSLLIYTIFFTLIFLVNQSAFIKMAGVLGGVPVKVEFIGSELYKQIQNRETFNPPMRAEVFLSDCFIPSHPELGADDFELVHEYCFEAASILCVFYDYYSSRFRFCKPLIYKMETQYYFDGTTSPLYKVLIDDEGTLELEKYE